MKGLSEIMAVRETCEAVNLSRTTLWRLGKKNLFPARVKLSEGRVGYRRNEVISWIGSRQAAEVNEMEG